MVSQVKHDPSPAEIREACRLIRLSWQDPALRARLGLPSHSLAPDPTRPSRLAAPVDPGRRHNGEWLAGA